MNAPATKTAPAMTPGLAAMMAALAVFFPTRALRAAAILWRVEAPAALAFVGGWIAPGVFLCATPPADALPAAARILTAWGYTLADAPPELLRATVAAMNFDAAPLRCDAEALALFLDSLPAIVTHATLADDGRRALDAAHLRAVLKAATGPVQVSKTVYREKTGNAAALLLTTPTWRAILKATDAETLLVRAPAFNPALPVALSCARCGVTAAKRLATEADARTEALRRRWTRREDDQGDVYTCANCSRVLARPEVA